MVAKKANPGGKSKRAEHAFRKAVLRGLAVVFPPLLTILIFVWVINTTHRYVLEPVTLAAREAIVRIRGDVVTGSDLQRLGLSPAQQTGENEDANYCRVGNSYVPRRVYDTVRDNPGDPPPQTAMAYSRRYVELTILKPQYTIPFILSLFVLVLYLLGKFMAAGIGRFFWYRLEQGITRLPLVRTVYSSVKQVSDFLFTEREIEYTRVVAVEYPRKGIWSLGLVTGESMQGIRSAAKEPVLSVLMPTSPMPVTGFTVTVRKSETIDLNISIDQAFQFIFSCGVVVPPQQLEEARAAMSAGALPGPTDAEPSPQAAPSEP